MPKRPPHPSRARGARSSYPGNKYGKLTVGGIVQDPDYYLCLCDCGNTVVMRASVIARRVKAGLPLDCGSCGEPVKERKVRAKRMLSIVDGGGRKDAKLDLPYTPPPPCEVSGRCEFFDTCKAQLLACQSFYRYHNGGRNHRDGFEPDANFFNLIYPGVRERELSDVAA